MHDCMTVREIFSADEGFPSPRKNCQNYYTNNRVTFCLRYFPMWRNGLQCKGMEEWIMTGKQMWRNGSFSDLS